MCPRYRPVARPTFRIWKSRGHKLPKSGPTYLGFAKMAAVREDVEITGTARLRYDCVRDS